jgi:hypothetical protein
MVADNNDPLRLGRVKCRCHEVLGLELATDWAAFKGGAFGGDVDCGVFAVPDIGSAVFIEFESGDVNRPLWSGTWWGQRKGQPPETPALARADGKTCWKTDPSTSAPKGSDSFKSLTDEDQCQPPSPLRKNGGPTYPYNKVLKTKNNGITIEIDDTPGKGRIHIWHGPSKSWIEIDNMGELSIRVAGKSYRLVEMDDRHHVKMNRHTLVEMAETLRVGTNHFTAVGANERRQVGGTKDTFVTGQEQRVNDGGLKDWVTGERVDVITGNYTLWVTGDFKVNVVGNFERNAVSIKDQATTIDHKLGAPTGSPPTPPTPPPPPPDPNCPPTPPDTSCPPTPPAP